MKKIIFILLAASALFTTGCASMVLSKTYKPSPAIAFKPAAKKLIVIKPIDERPYGGKSRIVPAFLTFIPLVPYGHQVFSPEYISKCCNFKMEYYGYFVLDLGKTIANDIKTSGLFEEVYYKNQLSDVDKKLLNANPYVLQISIKKAHWNRYITCYGLSILGDLLWYIGAPVSYGNVVIKLNISLSKANEGLINKKTIEAKERVTEWIYYPFQITKKWSLTFGQVAKEIRETIKNNINKEAL